MKKYLLIILSVFVFALVGCSTDNKESTNSKDVLNVGVTNFADSLEPTDNYFAWVVMRYGIGETLARFDEQMNVIPWIAESWSIADDKLTWTFKIKDNVTFSNGNKVTAEAVKSSIERVFEKSNRATTFFKYTEISANGQDLIIKTDGPTSGLPGMLADPLFLIIDTTVDRDYGTMGPIGTGPYVVKSFSKANAEMEKNDNYWDGEVPFNKVNIASIDDPNTRALALQSKEIDIALNIAPNDLSLFTDKDQYVISEIASLRTVLARLNVAPGRILNDEKVRAALISATDRKTYADVLLGGTFIPGKAPVPPSLDYGFDQLNEKNVYDVERAKKLLEEAGWKDNDGDGYLDKDGKTLELDFIYYNSRAELPLYAEAVQADAKKVGIKINLKNFDYNILDDLAINGEYDLAISNIITANTGDPMIYLNWYWKTNVDGDNPQNGASYSNKEFDEISNKLALEFDVTKRRDMMIQMQQILLDDSAGLFLGYPKTNMVFLNNIEGAKILPADYYWITKDVKPAK